MDWYWSVACRVGDPWSRGLSSRASFLTCSVTSLGNSFILTRPLYHLQDRDFTVDFITLQNWWDGEMKSWNRKVEDVPMEMSLNYPYLVTYLVSGSTGATLLFSVAREHSLLGYSPREKKNIKICPWKLPWTEWDIVTCWCQTRNLGTQLLVYQNVTYCFSLFRLQNKQLWCL